MKKHRAKADGPAGAETRPEDMALPLPWTHAVAVAHLDREGEVPFSVMPPEAVLPEIAKFLGVERIEGAGFEGTIRPCGKRGFLVAGRVGARVGQTCVVTLEPMETALSAEVDRRFQPGVEPPAVHGEIELGAGAENEPEPLGHAIDLGAIMLEALALEIDPYPRKPGAEHGARVYAPPGTVPLADEEARPFAGLAALRGRLGDGKDE